jgi:SAM-dependent MidA family methyltransferase
MPPVPPPTTDPPWRAAWDDALYGSAGFYRRESPSAHFRTSVHASPLFAAAIVRLAREAGLDTVVDIGAGRGELLRAVQEQAPDLDLLAVEVAPRPADLPATIAWTTALPDTVEGLVLANEWLDNIPCHVVEMGPDGTPRMVHVDATTGTESLGHPLTHATVPASVGTWLERWWPLDPSEPGTRAEIGSSRDSAWSDVVRRVTRGIAVAVDYAHTREDRPPFGSLRCYRHGSEVDVLPDGSRDVTAPVAVDALADRVGGSVLLQREALTRLGVTGVRPDLDLAATDPSGYVRALSAATEAAELTAPGGLGDYAWVVTVVGDVPPTSVTG